MSQPENPSAFPVPDVRTHDGFGLREGSDGMSLRDYFAAQVLSALLMKNGIDAPVREFAEAAYYVSDAMLVERAKATQS